MVKAADKTKSRMDARVARAVAAGVQVVFVPGVPCCWKSKPHAEGREHNDSDSHLPTLYHWTIFSLLIRTQNGPGFDIDGSASLLCPNTLMFTSKVASRLRVLRASRICTRTGVQGSTSTMQSGWRISKMAIVDSDLGELNGDNQYLDYWR